KSSQISRRVTQRLTADLTQARSEATALERQISRIDPSKLPIKSAHGTVHLALGAVPLTMMVRADAWASLHFHRRGDPQVAGKLVLKSEKIENFGPRIYIDLNWWQLSRELVGTAETAGEWAQSLDNCTLTVSGLPQQSKLDGGLVTLT